MVPFFPDHIVANNPRQTYHDHRIRSLLPLPTPIHSHIMPRNAPLSPDNSYQGPVRLNLDDSDGYQPNFNTEIDSGFVSPQGATPSRPVQTPSLFPNVTPNAVPNAVALHSNANPVPFSNHAITPNESPTSYPISPTAALLSHPRSGQQGPRASSTPQLAPPAHISISSLSGRRDTRTASSGMSPLIIPATPTASRFSRPRASQPSEPTASSDAPIPVSSFSHYGLRGMTVGDESLAIQTTHESRVRHNWSPMLAAEPEPELPSTSGPQVSPPITPRIKRQRHV